MYTTLCLYTAGYIPYKIKYVDIPKVSYYKKNTGGSIYISILIIKLQVRVTLTLASLYSYGLFKHLMVSSATVLEAIYSVGFLT